MTTCIPSDRILQTVKVHAPGVTDEMLQLQLFNVMDEFFRRTSAWRFHQDIDLVEDTFEYGFAVPANTQVVRLMAIEHQDTPVPASASIGAVQSSLGTLEPGMTFPDGDAQYDFTESDLDANTNVFSYTLYRPGYITITSMPDEAARQYPMKVVLALTLASGCLECEGCGDWSLEDWMWDMYFADFVDGMLGRLYGMPFKPWSNPNLGVYHGKRFRNWMALRKQESVRGFTYNVPTWRFPARAW